MGEEEKDYGEHELAESFGGIVRRFLHQAGVPHERVGEIAERAIGEATEELTDGANPQVILFRTAARIIAGTPDGEEPEDLFRFEEDHQLHREIRDLPARIRLPFILMRLHDFNPAEAGSVCRLTADEVRTAAETGERILTEADPDWDLDRQLSLLRRAYGRIRYPEPVVDQPATLALAEQEKDGPKSVRWWAAGAGLLAAVGFLIAAAFILPVQAGPVDAAYVKKLETRFDEEKERFQEKIGAQDMDMMDLITIQEGKSEFRLFISRLDRAVQKGQAPTKKEANEELAEILDVFDLPSEMAMQLSEQPINNDQLKSREYIRVFEMRKQELAMIFSNRLMEHMNFIEAAIHGEKFDKEGFLANADEYPESLRHALQLMEQEGYDLSEEIIRFGDHVYVIPEKLPTLGEHADGLEESVARVVRVAERVPLQKISDQEPVVLEETLIKLEELAGDRKTSDQWRMPEELAVRYFGEFVFGGESGRVFGEDGKVLAERRELWKRLAGRPESPSGKLLAPVVAEMEKTGWKRSKSYDLLVTASYQSALKGAREGHDRYSEIDDHVFLDGSFGNSDFRVRTETLYRDLTAAGDRSLLLDSTPVMVAALALLAADREDLNMMEILASDGNPAYITKLLKTVKTEALEEVHLSFSEYEVVPHETGVRAPVNVQPFSGFEQKQIWLTYTPEGLWLVDRQDAP
ncbi:hypothetical protein AV656_15370 [Bhargavaea cecembensis]|uniref:Uncharacterized protein n=1 Tax=Bhargavaea cecembensis TaxID=394098 RepID=A0A161SHN7_9BACL|nr:hypothetical protein [Bhargavaea cecembensis]KZE36513.1 hypothetical protein AV656_15370 [Bhargavaea cecembensis]